MLFKGFIPLLAAVAIITCVILKEHTTWNISMILNLSQWFGGDVVWRYIYFKLLCLFCLVEQKHLCDFCRWHFDEHSYQISLKLGKQYVVWRYFYS